MHLLFSILEYIIHNTPGFINWLFQLLEMILKANFKTVSYLKKNTCSC